MKILILTQTVDQTDPGLGFFHAWLSEFSKRFDSITVICLRKGKADLPKNVSVHSLGKESKESRLRYLFNFYRHILRERKNYDVVFVHMNTEYVILGSLIWALLRKPVILWYNHASGGIRLSLAALLVCRVLHTSPFAASARFRKSVRMPAGIDTTIFAPGSLNRKSRSLLFIGRIAPIKGVDVLIDAGNMLHDAAIPFTLDIYGDATLEDADYSDRLRKDADILEKAGEATFHKGALNTETPAIYAVHELFINLSPSGLFDKTVLEAMSTGAIVLASSRAFEEILPSECLFREGDSADLKTKIEGALAMPLSHRQELQKRFRDYVVERHSLSHLSLRLETLCKNLASFL